MVEPGGRSAAQEAYDLRMVGKTDDAIQLLQEALSTDPENPIVYYELARTQLYLLDIKGTQTSILQAVRLDPGKAGYHYFAGMSSVLSIIDAAHEREESLIRGFALKAVEELEEAIEIDPHVWMTVMPPPKEIFEPL